MIGTIRRILCPTDFSEVAGRAFEQAVALARAEGAEIELAHVHEALMPGPAGPTACPPWIFMDPAMRGRLLAALDEIARPVRGPGVTVNLAAYDGRVVPEIVERARRWPADLIVMGTHGRGGFERLILGSVAERVLRLAPCPVLVVPPHAAGAPAGAPPFRRILCAVDFSPASLAALRYAARLQEAAGATLTVLHVVEWQFEDEPGARLAGFDVPEFRRYLAEDARDRLARTLGQELRGRDDVCARVTGGRSWREILREAEERRADLVVVGVLGHRPVEHVLFGSTAQHVVRAASCPVLVVQEGREASPRAQIESAAAARS